MNYILRTASKIVGARTHLAQRFISLSHINQSAEGRIGYPNEKYEPTTIAALDTDNKRLPLITGLYDNGFLIAGQDRIIGSIFMFPRQVICWNVSTIEQITPESLAVLEYVVPRPEIFVLGFGSRQNQVPPKTIQYIRSLKIGFELLPTTQASETFNFLLSDNRLVYGGFLPQKDLADQNYGLRKALAQSQLYEKEDEFIQHDLLQAMTIIKSKEQNRKNSLRARSPLSLTQADESDNDENTQVQSLTGTSRSEKRPENIKRDSNKVNPSEK